MTSWNLFRSAAAAGLLVLALSACGSDDTSTATPAAPGAEGGTAGAGGAGTATDKVQVKDFAYKPQSITVKAGTAVTWSFDDDSDHNVEGVGGSELEKSPDLKGGKPYSFTFTKPGTNDYKCGIHNYMTGTVVVTA